MEGEKKFVFCILKNSKGNFLLQKKTSDYLGGKWVLFGGTIEKGEEAIDAGKRELFEELGVNIDLKFLFKDIAKSEKYGESLVFAFEGDLEIEEIEEINEGAGLAFFTKEEIEKLDVFYNSKWVLDKYFGN